MNRRVFLSAGEASGDAYGAALVRSIRSLADSPIVFEAVGSALLRDAQVRIVRDSGRWGAIGATQALRVLPSALSGLWAAKSRCSQGEPGLLIPIDFGFFNIRLARHAKKHGWRVLYFVPPGSWRRDRQGADLPETADEIVTPFSWSAEILTRMGASAHWFGHPLKQLVEADRAGIRSDGVRRGIAVLPGSRRAEIEQNLPVLSGVLERFEEAATFAVAPSLDLEWVRRRWQRLAPGRGGDRFVQGQARRVLLEARAGLICSGTATLEAVLCGLPHVVFYRISKVTELEARLIGFRPTFVSQPNIIMNRQIVPERLQHDAVPDKIEPDLRRLLADGPERQAQLDAFDELRSMLGGADAIDQTARLALSMLASDR
ncbi:MAG: hypothetical protein SNJ74_10695 [Fimbriimonadaceae bacterium]